MYKIQAGEIKSQKIFIIIQRVSYYEWVQNKASFYWTEEEVNERLTKNMQNSFEAVWEMQHKYNVPPRQAAYMVALERLVVETKWRGYNC